MRKFWINIGFVLPCLLLFACGQSVQTEVKSVDLSIETDSTLPPPPPPPPPPPQTEAQSIGDIDNDGTTDTVFITSPVIVEDMACLDSTCTTYFKFSGGFPPFSQEQALGGDIENVGDLDGDGWCEIYFVPDWFTSNWTAFYVYSLRNNQWNKIANASIRREDGGDENDKLYLAYKKRILKRNKEYFEILENVMDEEGNEKLVPRKFYFVK